MSVSNPVSIEKRCDCEVCIESRKFQEILSNYLNESDPQSVADYKFMENFYLKYMIAIDDEAFSEHRIKKFIKVLGPCKVREILATEL